MEKRKETTQKMEAVAKKLIRHSFLEVVEKWPPDCTISHTARKKPCPKRRSINSRKTPE